MKLYKKLLFLLLLPVLPLQAWAQEEEEPRDYIAVEDCLGCHEESAMPLGPHFFDPETDRTETPLAFDCQSCHGPGSVHADEGDRSFILKLQTDQDLIVRKCLSCHAKSEKVAGWHKSGHRFAGLNCFECHSIHTTSFHDEYEPETIDDPEADGSKPRILVSRGESLCIDCHMKKGNPILLQFQLPYRHANSELVRGENGSWKLHGVLKCSDCHNPHEDRNLDRDLDTSERCVNCHENLDVRLGYWHEAHREETACLTCHNAHGSPYPKNLKFPATFLCQSCHLDDLARAPHNESSASWPSCITCHAEQEHGSLFPGGFE